MSFLSVIIFIFINILSIIIVVYGCMKEKDVFKIIGVFIYIITIAILGGFAVKIDNIEPIEVYCGNTELQITYQDSIPIDSVVVYKNK